MELRDVLTKEASASMMRVLVRRSEQSLRDLAAFRKGFYESLLALESALGATPRDQYEGELAAFVERLATATTAFSEATTEQARAEAERRIEELGARVEGTVAELAAERQRAAAADADRDAVRKQLETYAARLEIVERAAREAENVRRELQLNLDAVAKRELALKDRLARAEAEAAHARSEAESTSRASEQSGRALEAARARIAELSSAQTNAQTARALPASFDFDRLIAIYQELERGNTIAEVLTALTKGLRAQFHRVALFNVTGSALQGVYQLGFDIEKDIAKIVMPLTVESPLTLAVNSGSVETAAAADASSAGHLPFGGSCGWCVAVPVALNGETIAVVYADEGDEPTKDVSLRASKVAFADLLRRHALPVLVKLTIHLKAIAELREYAALLLDEVEYIYGSDVTAAKENMELVERLTDNLRCAQETFARRLASTSVGDRAADVFESGLTAVIDARADSPFGRHLSIAAAAITNIGRGDTARSLKAAQAS